MSEIKSNEPPQNAIVPITEIQEPTFQLSPAQRREAEKFTVSYMQKVRIPMTSHGLKNATDIVLGDALPRGMVELGISRITPNDAIQKTLRAGINAREKLAKEARGVLSEYRITVQTQQAPFVGPYALPRRTLAIALNELGSFTTSPTLRNSEELLKTFNKRKDALPRVAESILSSLPQDLFPEAKIDMFPDPEEQAKLARNIIVSLIFRGDPNPVISINDLASFIRQDADLNSDSIGTLSELLTVKTGLDKDTVDGYIRDLHEQVKYYFENHKGENSQIDSSGKGEELFRANIYRYFGSTLLLLHPLLEDKPLITQPDAHFEGAYSLWSDSYSVLVKNRRVPTVEALEKAKRIEEVNGRNGSKFTAAIRIWRDYEKSKLSKQDRLRSIERQIKDLDVRISNTHAFEDIPGIEFDIAKATNSKLSLQLESAQRIFNKNKEVIEWVDDFYKKYHDFLLKVKRENGGEFPVEISLPWADDPETIMSTIVRQRTQRLELKTRDAVDTFSRDLLAKSLTPHERTRMYDFTNMDTQALTVALEQLKLAFQEIDSNSLDVILQPNLTMGEVKGHIVGEINSLERMRERVIKDRPWAHMSPESEKKLRDYRHQLSVFKMYEHIPENLKGIPPSFLRFTLRRRINALEAVLRARKKLDEPIDADKMGRRKLPAEEAQRMLQISEIQRPAEIADIVFSQALESMKNSARILEIVHRSSMRLSYRVQSREDLMQWLSTHLPTGNKYTLIYRAYQNGFETLAQMARNPLFPTDEQIKGLSINEAVSAVIMRVKYILASKDIEESRLNYENSEEQLREVALRQYLRGLNGKKDSLVSTKQRNENRDLEEEFLEKMEELNLVIAA